MRFFRNSTFVVALDRPDFDLAAAAPGSYALVPHDEMLANLAQDYNAMSEMIFGDVPAFEAIIESAMNLEKRLNEEATRGCPCALVRPDMFPPQFRRGVRELSRTDCPDCWLALTLLSRQSIETRRSRRWSPVW